MSSGKLFTTMLLHIPYCEKFIACADPGIFVRGVQVSLAKKSSDNVFFVFFLSSAYFTEVKWSTSKKSNIYQGSRWGPSFSRGGVQIFQGGPIAYFL